MSTENIDMTQSGAFRVYPLSNVTPIFRKYFGIFSLVGAIALLLYFLHIGCPIKALTGLSCPGCGMTRAWIALLALDIVGAFAFHPLFWLAPVAFVLAGASEFAPSKTWPKIAIAIAIVAIVVLWLARMFLTGMFAIQLGSTSFFIDNDIVAWSTPSWLSFLTTLV